MAKQIFPAVEVTLKPHKNIFSLFLLVKKMQVLFHDSDSISDWNSLKFNRILDSILKEIWLFFVVLLYFKVSGPHCKVYGPYLNSDHNGHSK